MKRYTKRFRLFATVALAAIALSTAPAMAGPGKGGGNGKGGGHAGGKGGGKPSSEFFASKGGGGSHGKPVWTSGGGGHGKPSWAGGGKPGIEEEECVDDGGCDVDLAGDEEEDENIDLALGEEEEEDGKLTGRLKGQTSASLKGVNGPVHASARALERASDKSIIGQARIWRDSVLAEEAYTDKQEEFSALMEERSQEEILLAMEEYAPESQEYMDLEEELETARSNEEIVEDRNAVLAEIEEMEDPEVLAQNSEDAYSDLTDDRTLTEEAYAVLRSALGLGTD